MTTRPQRAEYDALVQMWVQHGCTLDEAKAAADRVFPSVALAERARQLAEEAQ